jgi:myo-inositol-1(or 4)-monophosphatase
MAPTQNPSHSTTGPASDILNRIECALEAARLVASQFVAGSVKAERKASDRTLITEADRSVNRTLREVLLRDQEGWLSEEDLDNPQRLQAHRVWIVDPLDGTKEFVAGIPEWCISVAMIEDGVASAGGVCNPATGEIFLGSRENGVTYNGKPVRASDRSGLEGAEVLASRSETERGDWKRFERASLAVRPMGSVAYKLARVSAGLADATWTLSPKNEWDVAAGVALVEAAGGCVGFLPDIRPTFNNKKTLFPGLFACGPHLKDQISSLLEPLSRHS